jgi:hypothetical protein
MTISPENGPQFNQSVANKTLLSMSNDTLDSEVTIGTVITPADNRTINPEHDRRILLSGDLPYGQVSAFDN